MEVDRRKRCSGGVDGHRHTGSAQAQQRITLSRKEGPPEAPLLPFYLLTDALFPHLETTNMAQQRWPVAHCDTEADQPLVTDLTSRRGAETTAFNRPFAHSIQPRRMVSASSSEKMEPRIPTLREPR